MQNDPIRGEIASDTLDLVAHWRTECGAPGEPASGPLSHWGLLFIVIRAKKKLTSSNIFWRKYNAILPLVPFENRDILRKITNHQKNMDQFPGLEGEYGFIRWFTRIVTFGRSDMTILSWYWQSRIFHSTNIVYLLLHFFFIWNVDGLSQRQKREWFDRNWTHCREKGDMTIENTFQVVSLST